MIIKNKFWYSVCILTFICILIYIIISLIIYTKNKFKNKYNCFISFEEFDANYDIKSTKTISKILFKTSNFDKNNLPQAIIDVLENTKKMNPYYTQVYFDDNDILLFIEKYYPEYLEYYNLLIPGAYKADLFRLLLIYKYGGVYNDIGHTYLVPITNIIKNDDEYVMVKDFVSNNSNEYSIHNAFIAAYPMHPLINYMIKYIIDNIKNRSYGNDLLDITGPGACGKAFNMFLGLKYNNPIKSGEYILNGFKIKMYYHEPGYILNYDDSKETIIKTKFDNYQYIIYHNNNKQHYSDLYYQRKVYTYH